MGGSEALHSQYRIIKTLRRTAVAATHLVREREGGGASLVLKTFPLTALRNGATQLEDDLSRQNQLRHPNIVEICGGGIHPSGSSFFTVRPHCAEAGALTLPLLKAAASGVAFLARAGRFHGNIKPSNILASHGTVRLADADVGLVPVHRSAEDICFSAPEVLSGEAPDIHADYYALGALIYRACAGRHPFRDSDPESLKAKYLHARIPSLRAAAGVKPALSSIVAGLLSPDRPQRPQAFQRLLDDLSVPAIPATRTPLIGRGRLMEVLQSRLSPAPGSLAITLLHGDAGIGKTRLVEDLAFRFRLRQLSLYVASGAAANATPASLPAGVAREIVRDRFRGDASPRDVFGMFAGTLTSLLDSKPLEQAPPFERILHDWIGWIARLSQEKPLTLCLDGLDRLDGSIDGAASILKQLCHRASELNLHLLLTCRNPEALLPCLTSALPGSIVHLEVPRLEEADCLSLARMVDCDPARQAILAGGGYGNPRYILSGNHAAEAPDLPQGWQKNLDADARSLMQLLAASRGPAAAAMLARGLRRSISEATGLLGTLRMQGLILEGPRGAEIAAPELRKTILSAMSPAERRSVHGRWSEILRSDPAADLADLAFHAAAARLWQQASGYYLTLARRAAAEGKSPEAVRFFTRLLQTLRIGKQPLSAEDEAVFADCLARTGKTAHAARIFRKLSAPVGPGDSGGLQPRWSLARLDRNPLARRVALLKQALAEAGPGGKHPAVLYAQLCSNAVGAGDLKTARAALLEAKRTAAAAPDRQAAQAAVAAEAFLFMNTGHFDAAARLFAAVESTDPDMTAAVLTNAAICAEHRGDLQTACRIQRRAAAMTSRSGHMFGRISALANLGCFKVKLGETAAAERLFSAAAQLRGEEFAQARSGLLGLEAETASLHMLRSDYAAAARLLQTALRSGVLLHNERLHALIQLAELQVLSGEPIPSAGIREITAAVGRSESALYDVQWTLVRTMREPSAQKAVETLRDCCGRAREAGLSYETCRLQLELARRLFDLALPARALAAAEEAFETASSAGYRPLCARALLLLANGTRHPKKKKGMLFRAYRMAASMGMRETAAECAYRLAAAAPADPRSSAREWLVRSTTLSAAIERTLSPRARIRYLEAAWRRDAQQRLEESAWHGRPPGSTVLTRSRREPYLGILYDLSRPALGGTAGDFLKRASGMLHSAAGCRVPLLVRHGADLAWHNVDDADLALKKRLLQAASTPPSVTGTRTTSSGIWMSFSACSTDGAMHIPPPAHGRFREDEVEFFKVAERVIAGGLRQIESAHVPRLLPAGGEFSGMIGESPRFRELCGQIDAAARGDVTVLIEGETGAGKELVARAIHERSWRRGLPFVPIDCGALPDALFESELFGARRGAYSGASSDRIGLFEAAAHGTLFLDEISNLDLRAQAKLLRVLQERQVRRVGDVVERPMHARILAATNANLARLTAMGKFREDLLFRLNTIAIAVPPLRERREDIPQLAAHFLRQLNVLHNTSRVFEPGALERLQQADYPGNIRELKNTVDRAYFTSTGRTVRAGEIVEAPRPDEVRSWFEALTSGKSSFWTLIYAPYRRREISRDRVLALIDLGLQASRGSYTIMASMFQIPGTDYRRLMDFLRRNKCLLDFRPYRQASTVGRA